MKKGKSRSEQLPQYNTTARKHLVSMVTSLPGYQEGIDKGLPLFTSKELDEIKERYKGGLTWEEIDKELSGKGIFFKKATFRKYIQDGNISKAFDYKNTERGRRVALFPADTIAHINFIRYYYKVIDGEHVDKILDIIKDKQISYFEAIESNLDENLYASIFQSLCYDESDVDNAIKKALACRPNDQDKFLRMLNDIDKDFNKYIRKAIDNFVFLLKKEYLTVLDTIDIKETQDEQN